MRTIAPYGTWKSPLSAAAAAAGALRLGAVAIDGDDIYWLEGRPQEGGRNVLVRRTPDGQTSDATQPEFNVRSRVHEYGGGGYIVAHGIAYAVNFSDQRLYRINVKGDRRPEPITPAGDWYHADPIIDERRRRLICVREDHTQPGEPVNTLVSVPLGPAEAAARDKGAGPDGRQVAPAGPQVLASGHDFYSTPRLSPDGSRLAWLAWRHPQMPWDGTELWVAHVAESGALENPVLLAGGDSESIYQPGWALDGTLVYASDRSGWWQLYRSDGERMTDLPAAEFGRPQWVFGTATWACAGPDRIVVSYCRSGRWHLGVVDVESRALTPLAPDLHPHEWLAAAPTHAVFSAGAATRPDALVRLDLATGAIVTLREAATLHLDEDDISRAEAIEFPTSGREAAHAFFYAPRNASVAGPAGERPPLIVISHGGPTAAARPTLDLQIQFWTTRGFAVADVNYRGSSGYGRAYRERLNGEWGIVDVDDVIGAARALVERGAVDRARLAIRGGSAGGYTTLAALVFHAGVFKAGASYYGVSDLERLEVDTHKFESRYLHRLVGPYPEAAGRYRERSPIHGLDRLACPLILFQGLEDRVVPPNQAEAMAAAVRAKGLPVAYLAFDGEQHGFRRADTIVRCLEAELYFYGVVFGFTPADPVPPVHMDNPGSKV